MSTIQLNETTGNYEASGPISGEQVIECALSILTVTLSRDSIQSFTSPASASDFLRLALSSHSREVFACLFLDNRHRLIKYEELFYGTIDGASVYPREVVKAALQHNAAAVIAAHNHPSGVAEPSQSDIQITNRLKEALALIDVRLLDHFIVGEEDPTSLAENGLL